MKHRKPLLLVALVAMLGASLPIINSTAGENPIALRLVVSKPGEAQIARPDSTISPGQWLVTGQDAAPTHHESIDEALPHDENATQIQTANPPTDVYGEVGLSDVPDPGINTDHIMRVTHRHFFTDAVLEADLSLVEGTTVIATRDFIVSNDAVWQTSEFPLTSTEADAITDYPDLSYRIDGRKISGANRAAVITQAEFEVPGWDPLPCDGTAVVDGIGNLRMQGFATATTSSGSKSFKTKYTSGESTATPWYFTHSPFLFGGVETEVSDVVQDIDPSLPDHDFSFEQVGGTFLGCPFEAYNLPEESEGNKSHRTTAGHYVEQMRIEVAPYANPDNKFTCGDGRTAARLKVQVFATSSVSGDYDLHVHQEMENVIGPNQHGSDIDTRSWEMAMDNIRLQAGVEKLVGTGALDNHTTDPVTGEQFGPTRHTIHFAQQTAPDQPKNEVFCSSDSADNQPHH